MILTCPECKVQYKLDPSRLGEGGRLVRCTSCYHTWFEVQKDKPQKPARQEERAAKSEAASSGAVDMDSMFEVRENPLPENTKAVPTFETVLRKTAEDKPRDIPQGVKPLPASASVAMPPVYKPMGMGARQFGMLVFLALAFTTLILLFVLKGVIVGRFPVMTALYEAVGVQLTAPGEGLRLSELTADYRIDHEKKTLMISARLINMTNEEKPYPELEVVAKSTGDKILQVWPIPAEADAKPLAAGEERSVKLEFGTVPEETSFIDMSVSAH